MNFKRTTSALNRSLAEEFQGFGLQGWLSGKTSQFIISVAWPWLLPQHFGSFMSCHCFLNALDLDSIFSTALVCFSRELKAMKCMNMH